MVLLIRFLVGWITFIIVIILLFISRAICWDWADEPSVQPEDIIGDDTWDAMTLNSK